MKLWIGAQALYLLFVIVQKTLGIGSYVDKPLFETVIRTVAFGNCFGAHLWYLNALVYSLGVFLLIKCYKLSWLIPWMIIIGYLIGVAFGKYGYLFGVPDFGLNLSRNFFTFGIPMIGVGMLLRNRNLQDRCSNRIWGALSVFFLLLMAAEYYMLSNTEGASRSGDLVVMTLPAAVSVFCFFATMDCKFNTLAAIGKSHSSNIYIIHLMIIDIAGQTIFSYLGFNSVLVVFFASLSVSIAYVSVKSYLRDKASGYNLPER